MSHEWPITIWSAQPELQYQRTTAIEITTMAPAVEIVKHVPPVDIEAHILAMWLMYCRAPRKAEPDVDGFYDLAEIGADVEKNWSRLTPYSLARREP